jgi:hypothetical protein
MRLFEFDTGSATVSKIVALTNQLKQDLDQGRIPENFSLDDLLNYFQNYDVILDPQDLYNMIKVRPLKTLISNIQGDKVVFKGQAETPNAEPAQADDQKQVVAKMAQHALNK